MDPTPRLDRISKDYAHEYPSIEVESRKILNKPKKNNMENVKLTEEVGNEPALGRGGTSPKYL